MMAKVTLFARFCEKNIMVSDIMVDIYHLFIVGGIHINILFLGSDKTESIKAFLHLMQSPHTVSACACDTDSQMEKICNDNRVPVYSNEKLHESSQLLVDIDIGFSYLYQHRIKEPIISLAKLGIINFHPAPLPDHKGIGGCSYALLHGYTEWGVTAHYIDAGLDTGYIITRRHLPIENNITARKLSCQTQSVLFDVFLEVSAAALQEYKKLPCQEQEQGGHYFSRADLNKCKCISAQDSKEEINTKINALWLPPHEGAYIERDGEHFYLINRYILNEIAELYKKMQEKND